MKDDSRTKTLNRAATVVIAVLVVTGLGGFAAATAPKTDPKPAAPSPMLPVATIAARLESGYAVKREFVGRVEARRQSRVGFELSGRVTALFVDGGHAVQPGQTLGRLDTARLEVRLDELAGQRMSLEARIGLARATRVRQEQLIGAGHASIQHYDEALSDEAGLLGQLQAVDAQIELARLDIEKSALKAPFAAIVAGRFADEGIVIAAGTAVFDLVERTDPEVRIGLAGGVVDEVAVGQERTLTIRGRRVSATVRAVLPVRERNTRSVDVTLTLHVPLNGIRPGDVARLEIARQVDEPGFWLPLVALTESSRGLWAVYVANGTSGEPTVVERREIELLHQDTDRVFVRGTLASDDRVVIAGIHRLVPGQSVQMLVSDLDPSPVRPEPAR